MKIKATHRLLDSVWTVTAHISISTATIVAYSRDDEDGYRLEDSLPKCQLTEGNDRIVKSLEINWGGNTRRYTINNPQHIFSYREVSQ